MTRSASGASAGPGHEGLTRSASAAPVVVTVACVGCGACLPTCPEHALRPVGGASAGTGRLLVTSACTGCLECVEVCPVDAINRGADGGADAPCSGGVAA